MKSQGHSLTLVNGHSDFKVKCLTLACILRPHGPLVQICIYDFNIFFPYCHKPTHIMFFFSGFRYDDTISNEIQQTLFICTCCNREGVYQ